MPRETPYGAALPYGAFNYVVKFDNQEEFGGFSDVSGLGTEITVAEYRNGNEELNHVRKIPGIHKVSDVTLKRGIVDSESLWLWIEDVRILSVGAQKEVSITLLDEAREPVQTWTLQGVIPLKYTGPTFAGKGGGDVAMEELVLSTEGLIFRKGG
jgi:phage tail-like protein